MLEYGLAIGKKLCPNLDILDHIPFNYLSQGENQSHIALDGLEVSKLKFITEYINWLVTPYGNLYIPFIKDRNLVYYYHILLVYITNESYNLKATYIKYYLYYFSALCTMLSFTTGTKKPKVYITTIQKVLC